LVDGFADAASVLRMDIKAKLVLFKLFDRYVVQELPSVFKIIDHSLTEQGIAAPTSPRRQRAARADPYQNNSSQGNYDQGKSSSFNAGAHNNQPTNNGVGPRDNKSSARNTQALYNTLQSLLHVEPSNSALSNSALSNSVFSNSGPHA
jgi:hypothetical protein